MHMEKTTWGLTYFDQFTKSINIIHWRRNLVLIGLRGKQISFWCGSYVMLEEINQPVSSSYIFLPTRPKLKRYPAAQVDTFLPSGHYLNLLSRLDEGHAVFVDCNRSS